MIDLDTIQHHNCIEELTNLLCAKTLNQDKSFYRPLISYFLAVMASSQRVVIKTKDRGTVPVNLYVVNLAPSGYGKGLSMHIMEKITEGFRKDFMNKSFPLALENNLKKLASKKSASSGKTFDEEYDALSAQSSRAGTPIFVFDSGTTPALKQYRQKLLLAKAGALNFQCDEIGSNLLGNTEVMNAYLELFDQGQIKNKLVKNTADNVRDIEIDGFTPANCMLFGTQDKIFDGSSIEDVFYSFLEIGYARRCIFGIGKTIKAKSYYTKSPAEMYQELIQPQNDAVIDKWKNHFKALANPSKTGFSIDLPDNVAIKLLEYRIECEKLANSLSEYAGIKKAELSHRYYKALKLAGALAFVDNSPTITETILYQAIKLVEESGKSFQTILNRDKPYMKLAKYLMGCDNPVTHADLIEALPFYKSSQKNELMTLAQAYAYSQHGLIKKTYMDGIEFFKGEALEKTDLNQVILSYTKGTTPEEFNNNYTNAKVPFNQLHKLTHMDSMHWVNHHFLNGNIHKGHRCDNDVLTPFNLIVVDVDGDINIHRATDLMKDYTFFVHTTKSNTDENTRFRMVIPIAYTLDLPKEEFSGFMSNIITWLPFKTDDQVKSISKKWESCSKGDAFGPGINYFYNDGELLDPLPFIPNTMKNERYLKENKKIITNLDNLARWFALRMSEGNRNNNMLRYALALKDSGLPYEEVEKKVFELNNQLAAPLSKEELQSSVLVSTAKGYVNGK